MRLMRLLERQWLHAGSLLFLVAFISMSINLPLVREGQAFGLATPAWLWAGVCIAIAHQIFVWGFWRLELYHGALTRALGASAFPTFAVCFAVLGLLRLIVAGIAAYSNRDSLGEPSLYSYSFALALLVPVAYLMFSIYKYFGFKRAIGADHFFECHRNIPLVREGIFRWTGNAMYVFGFLMFWAIAIWYLSAAALVLAAFNHIYIWVHYFCTERPDMRYIYGNHLKTLPPEQR